MGALKFLPSGYIIIEVVNLSDESIIKYLNCIFDSVSGGGGQNSCHWDIGRKGICACVLVMYFEDQFLIHHFLGEGPQIFIICASRRTLM